MRTSSATATPSTSTIAAPSKKTSAPRLARATVPAVSRAERESARQEAARRERAETRKAVLRFLRAMRPRFFAADQVAAALGMDHDPVLDQLADLSNDEIDCRRFWPGTWEYAARGAGRRGVR